MKDDRYRLDTKAGDPRVMPIVRTQGEDSLHKSILLEKWSRDNKPIVDHLHNRDNGSSIQ